MSMNKDYQTPPYSVNESHTAISTRYSSSSSSSSRHRHRQRHQQQLRAALVLLLASAQLVSPAAAAVCGQVAVYVASTPLADGSSSTSYFTLGTEWGLFPNEPSTESLCIQEAVALNVEPQKQDVASVKASSYGTCSDVRGSADVSAAVNAMSKGGWPRLGVAGSSKSCWCAEGSWQPFVRVRVRQVTSNGGSSAGGSGSSVNGSAIESGRKARGNKSQIGALRSSSSSSSSRSSSRRQGRRLTAAMMPLWPEDDDDEQQQQQQQQQLAGPDGCKGGAVPGTTGPGHTVLLDSWFRVVRDETICQDSGLGHSFTIVFRLSDKC